ncbi:MAG TPA: zinc-binding dehydrogenase, partial [Tepidisphaeraceae bacterium]
PPWEGRPWFIYPMPPGQLGHEAWGFVDAVDAAVTSFAVGDRVAVLSQNAYAEYDVAAADQVVALPESLADTPFPAEPLGCAMNIFARSGIRAGQTVAIIGIGFLGAILTRLAEQAGARVIAISRRPYSIEVARQMGAHDTVLFDEPWRVTEHVARLTNGTGGYDVSGFCDVVIECTGKQIAIDLAGELCAVRGRLVIAGYHQDGLRQINLQLWNWRGLDVINAHERDPKRYLDGMRDAVTAVASGRLDPSSLYTHVYPLDRLADALNATRDRPDGFLKALVLM